MHATLTNGAVCTPGTGVAFDGANDYVDLAAVPLGGAMTIAFWAKWDTVENWARLADFSGAGGCQDSTVLVSTVGVGAGTSPFLAGGFKDSGRTAAWFGDASHSWNCPTGCATIVTGEWTHVALSVEAGAASPSDVAGWRYYVQGQLQPRTLDANQ